MKLKSRKIVLWMFYLLIGFNTACINEGETSYGRWELYNDSNHSIEITIFENFEKVKQINLKEKGSFWSSEVYKGDWGTTGLPPIFMVLEGDSLTITFDSTRQAVFKTYAGTYDKFNIYQNASYNTINESETQYILRYTFTEADYENAEPIGAED